jgi:hypothetical protein
MGYYARNCPMNQEQSNRQRINLINFDPNEGAIEKYLLPNPSVTQDKVAAA